MIMAQETFRQPDLWHHSAGHPCTHIALSECFRQISAG